jgi:hypothetical protein
MLAAFATTIATTGSAKALAATVTDPIFAAIEADAALWMPHPDCIFIDLENEDALTAARDILVNTEPTTIAGARAALAYLMNRRSQFFLHMDLPRWIRKTEARKARRARSLSFDVLDDDDADDPEREGSVAIGWRFLRTILTAMDKIAT